MRWRSRVATIAVAVAVSTMVLPSAAAFHGDHVPGPVPDPDDRVQFCSPGPVSCTLDMVRHAAGCDDALRPCLEGVVGDARDEAEALVDFLREDLHQACHDDIQPGGGRCHNLH